MERGRNQNREQTEREETERTERRHFARRHPRSWGHDEMRIELVKKRLEDALDALDSIGKTQIIEESEVVSTEDAGLVGRAYEALDNLYVHLPEIMAWSVGYEAFGGWSRSIFHACTTEEQAKEIAAAMNLREGLYKPPEFDVELCPCRIIDMVKPEFTAEDI